MVDKEHTPRTNIVILAVVAVIALTLSIMSYQYSILTSNKIIDVAKDYGSMASSIRLNRSINDNALIGIVFW